VWGQTRPHLPQTGLELAVASRRLWLAAIVVSVVCVAALGYALVVDWDTRPEKTLPQRGGSTSGSGFGLGLMIGIGAGIAIGSLIALRKRH